MANDKPSNSSKPQSTVQQRPQQVFLEKGGSMSNLQQGLASAAASSSPTGGTAKPQGGPGQVSSNSGGTNAKK